VLLRYLDLRIILQVTRIISKPPVTIIAISHQLKGASASDSLGVVGAKSDIAEVRLVPDVGWLVIACPLPSTIIDGVPFAITGKGINKLAAANRQDINIKLRDNLINIVPVSQIVLC